MFLDEKRNILNTQDNKKKLIKMENSEKKEINNINIPLINVKENFQPSNNLMSKKIYEDVFYFQECNEFHFIPLIEPSRLALRCRRFQCRERSRSGVKLCLS